MDDLKETIRENEARAGDLWSLARRCERAASSCRYLDGHLWAAFQGVQLLIWERPPSSGEVLSYRGTLAHPDLPGVPPYTSSTDAAMTLIPDGLAVIDLKLSWDTLSPRGNPACTVRWYAPGHSDNSWQAVVASGKTPALAICNAAFEMRARALVP